MNIKEFLSNIKINQSTIVYNNLTLESKHSERNRKKYVYVYDELSFILMN